MTVNPYAAFDTPLLERPMPQSPDAERAVLGSIIINNRAWYRLPAELSADDFFKDAHRIIFGEIARMAEDREEIEPLTLKESLARRSALDQAGGVAYISSLLDSVPDVANVERYAAIVLRMSKKRAQIVLGNSIMREALDPETEPEDVAASALASLSAQATREDNQARPIVEVMKEAFEKQQRMADEGRSPALDCGFPVLNEFKIFYPTLIVCSGEKGTGKSALMANFAKNLAKNGHRPAILSLESSEEQISLRMASIETGIPHSLMRDWRTWKKDHPEYYDRVGECLKTHAKLGIQIAEPEPSIDSIIIEIRRLRAMKGIGVAFIDYVQLIQASRRFDRHDLMLGDVAQRLRYLAQKEGIPVCVFSQKNKDGNVKQAEAIEEAARVRIDFSRPNLDDPAAEKQHLVEMHIIKNNEERTNRPPRKPFICHFDEVTQRFDEGTCEQNDCRSVRTTPVTRELFRQEN